MKRAQFAGLLLLALPLRSTLAQVAPVPLKVQTKPVIQKPAGGGAATPRRVSTQLAGSVACASAAARDAISGNGTFVVGTTAETTGSPLASCGLIGTDAWFSTGPRRSPASPPCRRAIRSEERI